MATTGHNSGNKLVVRLHPSDNVVTARLDILGNTSIDGEQISSLGSIPSGHKLATKKIKAGEELIFKELLPSIYQLRLTLDSNNDGKWTAGDYFENSQVEKVIYYKEELKLRANWELEIDFNPID